MQEHLLKGPPVLKTTYPVVIIGTIASLADPQGYIFHVVEP